jgi:hypothetical protein
MKEYVIYVATMAVVTLLVMSLMDLLRQIKKRK